MTRPITSTYRVELSAEDLTFAQVAAVVPYLADMGTSHLHLSPVLAARSRAPHLHDVVDHGQVDEALGGEAGLRALAEVARDHDMGLVADLVCHHVAVGAEAPLWERLLEEGRSSEVAKVFDVDWESPLPGSADKVILPVLREPYGDALAAGRIGLRQDGDHFRVVYGERSFPVNAASARALERSGAEGIAGVPGEERTWQRMHSLLEQQHYRLVSARAGARLVNYRRFRNVDDLAAVRVEDDGVFDAVHATMVRLVADEVLDGLCIGHIDGLADPARYLQRLRAQVGPDVWLVVEVFGGGGQVLPEGWPVDGTTGYELLRLALGLQVDPAGLRLLRDAALRHDALPDAGEQQVMREAVMDAELGPDLRRVARAVWTACQDEPRVRDVDYRTLLEAVSRLVTSLSRHRTYVDPETGEASEEDRAAVAEAVGAARARSGPGEVPDRLWAHLQAMLSGELRWSVRIGDALTRLQQLTGPVMSLGVEQRLFGRHNALVAACELGCNPDDVTRTLPQVHAAVAALPPAGLRVTATSETLHGEDARLRMAALAGLAADWVTAAEQAMSRVPPPDPSLGLRLLQVAVGIWPAADDGSGDLTALLDDELRARFAEYAVVAARGQARVTTAREPVAEAEASVRAWAAQVLQPSGAIAPALREVAVRAAEVGMAASLSQALLRLTLPGVAETYQGTEVWDGSLRSSGGRRAVDFEGLQAQAGDLRPEAAAALWEARRDGRVKHHVTRTALQLRRRLPDVLGPGGVYGPVTATGRWSEHIHAYSLRAPDGDPSVVVVAPRAFGRVTDGGCYDPRGRIWADTDVQLPGGTPRWTDALTGSRVHGGEVPAADLLATLPVALLVADRS